MITKIFVDTGAIVGALSKRDQHSTAAGRLFREIPKPLYTCEPVMAEVLFLLKDVHSGRRKALDLIANGVLRIGFSLQDEIGGVSDLMSKYESLPMSLADACLVRMSEIDDGRVFTFDSDFRIYRRNGRQAIPLIGLE